MLTISKGFAAKLRDEFGSVAEVQKLSGMPIAVSDHLPTLMRSGKIIQKDPFATYDDADMWWAEPAKLAAWEMVPCHAVEVPDLSLWPINIGGEMFFANGRLNDATASAETDVLENFRKTLLSFPLPAPPLFVKPYF